MSGFWTLLSLCIVMGAASFLAGVLPLSIKMSAGAIRLVSTVGMGVLVGTALIVVIPEGIESMNSLSTTAHGINKRYSATNTILHGMPPPDINLSPRANPGKPSVLDELANPGPVLPDNELLPPLGAPEMPKVTTILEHDEPVSMKEESSAHETLHHAWIGVALISGFMLMFLVDEIPRHALTARTAPQKHQIALNNLGSRFGFTTRQDDAEEHENFLEDTPRAARVSHNLATTIGLVIHATADGIALGASGGTTATRLSFIIFFAIMIHKAPAAFGLTSVLLKQGLSRREIRAHLIIFSLAAPAGALMTWFLVDISGGGSTSDSADLRQWWTSMLLLFSGGTFLYVAMHSMREVMSEKRHDAADGEHEHALVGGSGRAEHLDQTENKSSMADIGAALVGMVLPLFLQFGPDH